MNKSRCFTNAFCEICRERDHVMIGRFLDLIYAVDGECGLRFDLRESIRGDNTVFRMHLANGDLDIEPLLEFVLLGPDGAHFGQCIAFDHFLSSPPYEGGVAAVSADGVVLSHFGNIQIIPLSISNSAFKIAEPAAPRTVL